MNCILRAIHHWSCSRHGICLFAAAGMALGFTFSIPVLAQSEVPVLVGPELEVQRGHTERILEAIDWDAAERRWGILLDLLGEAKTPEDSLYEAQRRLHEGWSLKANALDRPFPGEWEKSRRMIVIYLLNQYADRLMKLKHDEATAAGLDHLRRMMKLAPHSAQSASMVLQAHRTLNEEIAPLRELLPNTGSTSRMDDFREWAERGPFSLKGDRGGEFRIHWDRTVFEITRSPPLKSVEETRNWMERFRALTKIPDAPAPAFTINPHFHLSRQLPQLDLLGAERLAFEYRVYSALFTVENSLETAGLKASRPFYGGMNSLNAGWSGSSTPAVSAKGNVRIISGKAGELRIEFRSLGAVPWEKTWQFMQELEQDFKSAESLEDLGRKTRARIAGEFQRISPERLQSAVKASMDANQLGRPVEDVFPLFNEVVGRSLLENGKTPEAVASLLAEKWGSSTAGLTRCSRAPLRALLRPE